MASAKQVPARDSKVRNVILWILSVLVAVAFIGAGGSKLAGAPEMVAAYDKIGVGQWFRYLTAFIEIGSGIGLLIPKYAFYAAAMLVITMVGAVIAHLTALGGSPAPALVLLVLSAVIAWLRKP